MKPGVYPIEQNDAAVKEAFALKVLVGETTSCESPFAVKMEGGDWEISEAYLSGNGHGVTLQTKMGLPTSRRHVFFPAGPGQWDHVDDHGSLLPLMAGNQIIGEIHRYVQSQESKSSPAA